MPDEYVSFSTAPLPLLFTKGVNGERGESSNTTFYMSLRSQDVFRHSTKIVYPETEIGITKAFLKAVSFCTSSWRTPSVCELDAPATSTRFLFYLHIKYTEHDYIVSELLLSPTSTFPPSKSSVSSVNAETPENEFIPSRINGNAMHTPTKGDICLICMYREPLEQDMSLQLITACQGSQRLGFRT